MEGRKRTREELLAEIAALRQRATTLEASEAELRGLQGALAESEARYRSLVKQSSDGVYIFDPHTASILEANDQLLRMLAYTEEEITSLTLYDIVVQDPETVEANIAKALKERQYVLGMRRYRRKDESLIDVEISATLITYGRAAVVMVSVRDVTERREAEEELRRQASMLREQAELLDIAEDVIMVHTIEGRILFWNQGAAEKYQWSKEEAAGQTVHKLLKTKFPEPFLSIKRTVLERGRWEGEIVQTARNGRKIVVESKWALRKDKEGRPLAIMEIDNDITERKHAEEDLRRAKGELEARVQERTAELRSANERLLLELGRRKRIEEMLRKGAERYKNLFENSPVGIYRTNAEGRILMANPTLLRMIGYKSVDEMGATGPATRAYEPSYLKKRFKMRLDREGRVRGFEVRWKRRDKSIIFVRENAKAIRGADGVLLHYEGTVEDISEQKQAEEQIHAYQKQLRSLAAELSLAEERERRRIATVLHDQVGQTLAVSRIKLGGLIEGASETGLEKGLREVRGHVETAIRHTRSLTFELSPPILYDLGLEMALEWLVEQVHDQHCIDGAFETDGKPKPVSEELRVFLFTAVRELLVNVVKHARATQMKVTTRGQGENMSIHVADDGVGFNASKKRLYTDESKGFGLFSIRERIQHLGGHMEVKSGQGRGTRVILLAPLYREGNNS
jgi:PAS domain S-box-containing protein